MIGVLEDMNLDLFLTDDEIILLGRRRLEWDIVQIVNGKRCPREIGIELKEFANKDVYTTQDRLLVFCVPTTNYNQLNEDRKTVVEYKDGNKLNLNRR
ncbi:MAG TPA: hypothetical protein VJB94_02275 [Candidatus Nanoarchaeia archaeon]|nr:hypothetical protein [Candidatus Nanoarchaeia archaeon]